MRTLSLEEITAEFEASQARSDGRRMATARRRNIVSFVLAVLVALMVGFVAVLGVYVF